jgi:hypothetical protein
MKFIFLMAVLGSITSCSTLPENPKLSEKIQSEEVRSLQEIKSHAEMLLDEHPELDETTKDELRGILNNSIATHQNLKDQESKILQLLLDQSFKINQLTPQELKEKNELKLRLSRVYTEKSNNVFALIKSIVDLSKKRPISEGFRNDMLMIMRDFR